MKPHKHAELIKAWADGASIEKLTKDGWLNCEPNYILWSLDVEYRIKPEPVTPLTRLYNTDEFGGVYRVHDWNDCALKLTFNGETGELKSAEVLK